VTGTTRVDFHCHSTHSDGALSPRELAEQLATDGVSFAALTDHDAVGGLAGFRRSLERRGVGCIAGIEMTAQRGGEEVHLLGYGFDPENAELQTAVLSVRQARPAATQSVAGSIRKMGSHDPGVTNDVAANGRIEIGEAIALIHRAGGRAFLAHPLTLEPDFDKLRDIIGEFKAQGLDGIEAFYAAHTDQQRERLREMAEDLGLLVCGGSDTHERRGADGGRLGVDMPTKLWKRFRDAVCRGRSVAEASVSAVGQAVPRHRLRKRHFFLHVVLPTFLAIALFAVAIFAVIMPAFERSLLERKREMIQELTRSAWSILAGYEQDERAGKLSRDQAQKLAAARIELLRYGREGKDYFWLQDMQPQIIMHPYRKDLNGQDVSEFVDARGVRIFVEFADLVRREQEGYIDYVWQWKDDPSHLAAKESYVKSFAPWGWIIGTGIYLEDVHEEIAAVKRRLVHTSLGISVIVALLLLYVMRHSLRIERRRSEAEEGLRESTERYRSLVEATTEGTLLALDGRCHYANPILLGMLGCSEQELALLDLEDVIPPGEGNETAWEKINLLLAGEDSGGGFDGVLKRRDGAAIECVFAISQIEISGRSGLIVLVTPIGAPESEEGGRDQRGSLLAQVSDGVPGGVFRARATAQGTVLAASASAERLLRPADEPDHAPLALPALFEDAAAYREFLAEVQREGTAERRLHVESADGGALILAIRAVFADGEGDGPGFVDGIVEDVTVQDRRAAEREAQFERLQASMLFLHEPVSQIGRSAVFCRLDASVQSVAAMMTASESSAALVQAQSGEVVGIFTDSDLRERVVATGMDMHSPVSRVMSSPLVSVPEHAGIYEALLAMEEKGVGHLAVVDDAGKIIGVIRERELLGFQSYGPIVLSREIAQAATAAQRKRCSTAARIRIG
jgi:PAS domain S-box-containing protein